MNPFGNLLKTIDLFGRDLNMTYDGYYKYKTYCGASATIIMTLTLIFFFISETLSITKGKLLRVDYMLKNNQDTKYQVKIPNNKDIQVFGFAFENSLIDNSIYSLEFGSSTEGRTKFKSSFKPFDCTNDVYNQLASKVEKIVPINLKIQCFKIDTNDLFNGIYPTLRFKNCIDGFHDPGMKCRSPEIRNQFLNNFKIWFFAMTDQSDFTKRDTFLIDKFSAVQIASSNKFQKKVKMFLRNVEVQLKRGLLQSIEQISTNMFLRVEQWLESLITRESFLEFRLELDQYSKVVINKEYRNYLDSLAYLGGISRAIGVLLFIFVWPVREILFYRDLINQMFSVCADKTQILTAMDMIFKGESELEKDKVMMNQDKKKRSRFSLGDIRKAFLVGIGKMKKGVISEIEERRRKSKEIFFENVKGVLEDKQDVKKLSDIVLGGIEYQSKVKRMKKEEFNLKDVLRFESVQGGLKKWARSAQREVERRKRDVVKDEVEDKEAFDDEEKGGFEGRLRIASQRLRNLTKKDDFWVEGKRDEGSKNSGFVLYEKRLGKRNKLPSNSGGGGGNDSSVDNKENVLVRSQGKMKGVKKFDREKKIFSKKINSGNTSPKRNFKVKKLTSSGTKIKKNIDHVKEKSKKLKLKILFKDFFKFWIPDSVKLSSKKDLFRKVKKKLNLKNFKGRKMINRKIDVANIINSLNELEKLKYLLFDEDQFYIFEHIPKPYLINSKVIRKENLKKKEVKFMKKSEVLVSGNEFWRKGKEDERMKAKNFAKALRNLRKKEELNTIDKRLLEMVRLYHE